MSVLQIDYYKNGQFKGASGASIFQSSNSQSSIAFKFEDDIEDAIVFANILLPYPENSQLYGQYKAQSLIMEKKVDPNGGYIYIGQLLAQYLQTNGKAYVNAQIQASEGLYKFQNDTTQPQYITLAGVVYTISTSTVTIDGNSVDLLVLTNNVTGKVYNQVNAGVITVENVIYKITEFDANNDILKMESGFAVDNYQRVEFKITASAPYYAAMPMTPEESIIFADAIAKNQYDIVNLQQDKQDKEDPTINPDVNPGDDNDHTVVGNINKLLQDDAQNTSDISDLQYDMSQAQSDIHDLQVLVGYGVNIVGEMTTIDALPSDAQVSAFVTAQTGEAPVRGQAVIVRVDYTSGTDTIYLYVYSGTEWKHFEMQFLNDAGNGIKGLIAGNYNAGDLSTPDKFMVNISNGQILDIVRVDPNGNYVTLKDALDLIIAKVLDTSTGAVNRAKMDANGNNIASTYQTKLEGASKDYVKQYASPKALYDLNYPDYALGQFKNVEVSDTSYNKTTNSTSIGYTTLATITKSLEADILLGDQNGLVNRLWISANITEDVKLRITTAYIDGNNQTQTLSVEETDTFGLVTGIAKLLQIESVFSGLTQPITLPAGTTLTQTIEVWREASASADFTLLSNTTYNAYMTLNKIGYVRYALEQEPSAIETGHDSAPTIDSDGDLLVQSIDGKMHYANGSEQELTTILKVPMASGINPNEVRPPKAGDVKDYVDNAISDKIKVVDISTWEINTQLTAEHLAILSATPTPTLKKGNLILTPTSISPSQKIWVGIVGDVKYTYSVVSNIGGLSNEYLTRNSNIANDYSSSSTYAVGDYVFYGNILYRCTTAITTAESWTSAHWTQVKTTTDIKDNTTNISNLQSDVAQRFKVYNLDGSLIGTNISNDLKTLLTTNPRPIIFFNNQYYYPSSGSGTLFYWDLDNADPSTGVLKTIYLNGNLLDETTAIYPTTAQLNAKASQQYVDDNFASNSVAGQEYDPTQTYNQYDTCRHNGKAYYRSSSTPATGTWSDTGWTEFDMGLLFFVTRDLDDKKLDKNTTSSTYWQLYGRNTLGDALMLNASSSTIGNGVPIRDANGQVLVPETPTANGHATSKKYVDDSISALGTWEDLTVTASPNNFNGTVWNFNYNCSVNRKLRLLSIGFRCYMNVNYRTGSGCGVQLTFSDFTFPQYVQVRGSSQLTKLNSLAEDSAVVGAGRGVYFEAAENSNILKLFSNESYTNIESGIYFIQQNVMIPY